MTIEGTDEQQREFNSKVPPHLREPGEIPDHLIEKANTDLRIQEVQNIQARNYSRELPDALVDMFETMTRNAMQFAWEIGNGADWDSQLPLTPDNPFIDVHWAKNVIRAEALRKAREAGHPSVS